LNNNRNNRRRGRGNRNQPGNGNQLNRIDSRARGNAPQLLDKYKKLAQDAQHNGDRVQMEYYLQFADHYFRVIADNKARQDEARGGRRNDEREVMGDDGEDDGEFDSRRRDYSRSRSRSDDADEGQASASDDEAEAREQGEYGQEGEPFLADADVERAPARRTRQRKPREDGAAEKSGERTSSPRRKPRRSNGASDDAGENSAIDSAVLPPSIRAEEPGDNDGSLETVS
jgi:hypothetical protein